MRNFIAHIFKKIKFGRFRLAEYVARLGDNRNALKNRTGKGSLGKHRWKVNMRMNLKGMNVNVRNWFESAQDRDYKSDLMNEELNTRVL